jgi:hypothetical protein
MNEDKPRKNIFPLLLVIVGALLLIGAGVWFFYLEPQSSQQPVTVPQEQDIPYPEISRVSLPDAKAALDQGTAILVDVRGEQYYQQSHIAGALSLPEDQLPDRIGELDPQDWIITYCT